MGGNKKTKTPDGFPTELRMVMIGGGGVGKSALTIRFVQNHFVEEYDPTIEDSYRKQVCIDDSTFLMDILDTAGEEEFSAMRDQYTRTGQFFFLVFSIDNQSSFDAEIPERLEHIRRMKEDSKEPYYLMLVGNKNDLENQREVPREKAMEFAEMQGIPYKETSALTGDCVEEMYFDMVRFARDNTYPQQQVVSIKKAR